MTHRGRVRGQFVDGIGSRSVLEEMRPLVSRLLEASLVADLESVTEAVRTLAARNQIVAEGAGATSVAVALAGGAGTGKVVCIVSGGNIDLAKLATIHSGE